MIQKYPLHPHVTDIINDTDKEKRKKTTRLVVESLNLDSRVQVLRSVGLSLQASLLVVCYIFDIAPPTLQQLLEKHFKAKQMIQGSLDLARIW